MFLIPLGLGLRLPKIPYTCITLALINIFLFFYNGSFDFNHSKLGELFQTSEKQEKIIDQLVVEYCELKGPSAAQCRNIESFFKNLEREKTSEVLKKWNLLTVDERKFIIKAREIINLKSSDDILTLPSFHLLIKSLQEQVGLQHEYIVKNNLLAKDNISFSNLLIAQFSHTDWSHLMVNVVFLLIFGPYVEFAITPLLFSLIYFLGGFIGLSSYSSFFVDQNIPVLGSSANVAGIIGAFFILFLHKKMKFFVLIFFYYRIAKINVMLAMPIIFFARELFGSLEKDSTIAHQAHLAGYIIGIGLALIYKMIKKQDPNCLYPFEDKIIKSWENKDLKEMTEDGSRIFRFNPNNSWARKLILKKSLMNYAQGNLSLIETSNLINLLAKEFEELKKQKNSELSPSDLEILALVPISLPIHQLIIGWGKDQILHFSRFLYDKKLFPLSLVFFHLYYDFFPSHKQPIEHDSMVLSILGKLPNSFYSEAHSFIRHIKSEHFKNILDIKIEKEAS